MSADAKGCFSAVPLAPPNSILGVALECKKDSFPDKIDLTIGAYRDENGKPLVLDCVREAEEVIFNLKMDHEYQNQDGHTEFNLLSQRLLFGDQSNLLSSGRIYSIQGISGTGSLRLGAEFIAKFLGERTVYYPSVTWPGHPSILEEAGVKAATYRYLDSSGIRLDITGMLEDLSSLADGSILIFHNCAHNPSGIDPSEDQWREIMEMCKRRNYLPFFDNAYQGFVSGDPNKDAFAVRLFAENGFEMMVACSFAKNFGLYGERVGALHFVAAATADVPLIASQMRVISRSLYSTTPLFGARIVALILGDDTRRAKWEKECAAMARRISGVREQLYNALVERRVKGDWSHVTHQRGMFSYTGIRPEVVARLIKDFHIYLLGNGRISMAGLNAKNIPRFADALAECIGVD
jgi:aspartate/tyrosine/aromatic aminotransferase